jgi:hypothetical protein
MMAKPIMPTTTRTLNPLPFDSIEPRRFEDLIRQLAYDFRRWRMLEATGRAGSDDGYDARGFEVTDGVADEPQEALDIDDDAVTPEPATDNLWLIQCKRERVLTPAKMKLHLAQIPEAEARKVYGVIFAAACDFSKGTRDVALSWGRDHGISEIHIWGKAEVEDQLFQPKNDHLLFAYFGISLQIRRRSMRATLRAKLTMKRKVLRHLGDGWHDNKVILLRDPEDANYPYINDDKEHAHLGWWLTEFGGNHLDCIKVNWRRFFAYFSEDGKHWDFANAYNDTTGLLALFRDPWLSEEHCDRLGDLRPQIHEFWQEKISEQERAHFKVECFIRYDDIIEIDEKGDDVAQCPHVFVSLKDGAPLRATYSGELIVPGRLQEANGPPRISEPRTLVNPDLSNRVDIFPPEFRKPIR